MSEKKNDTFNVSGEVVKEALEREVAKGNLTEAQKDLIWWFFAFSKSSGFSLTQAAHELSVSGSTVWRVVRGEYEAKYDNVCDKIARYKALSIERASITHLNFVETSISKKIWMACDAALISQTIVLMYGDSQIGKTTALEEYARRHNHGQTKYIRLPASAGVQLCAKEIAKACFVSTSSSFEGLRDRILKAIDDKNLIIIDELHQSFMSYQKQSQIKVLEFIREIYDRTQCGMVLCGTNVLRDEIMRGKQALLLEQLRRRCTHPIQLPSKPPKRDLLLIADKFNLEPPESEAWTIIQDQINTSGMGMYIKFLQAASRMAAKAQQELTWDHFIKAHNIIRKLNGGK